MIATEIVTLKFYPDYYNVYGESIKRVNATCELGASWVSLDIYDGYGEDQTYKWSEDYPSETIREIHRQPYDPWP